MERFRDRADDALRQAEGPALRRISADAGKKDLPAQVKRLLKHLEGHLFDPDLNVGTWCRDTKVGDTAVKGEFRAWFGVSMKDYYKGLRLETGARMLSATDLDERRISHAVGFPNHRAFWNLYKEWTGKTPNEGRDLPAPWFGPVLVRRARCGELTAEEIDRTIAELHRLHPHLRRESAPRAADAAPEVLRIVDGGAFERFVADELWQRIRSLPFDEQTRQVRGYRFSSTVFFDLLRKKSREEGRKDRKRGVQIARLALASLERHDEVFGERIHDLRALAWASIANARRLQLDFDGAEEDLASSDEEWAKPSAFKNLRISTEILFLKAALRTHQRRFAEALELVDESLRLAELEGEPVLQAQALTLRASVNGYTERLEESDSDLRHAAALLEGRDEAFLEFTIRLNQANTQMKLGYRDCAAASLSKAVSCCKQLDYPLGWHRLKHLEGAISELIGDANSAARAYVEALEGFLGVDEPHQAAFVALELAILDARQGKRQRALALTRWTIPVLQSMKLHEETVAAIELLDRESAAMQVDHSVLRETVRLLRLDPLSCLSQQTRARRTLRPSCLDF